MYGTNNPNSKYKEEDYFCVLYYLGYLGYTFKAIEDITGVSIYVIQDIATLKRHAWLAERYPELYAKIVPLANNHTRFGITARG